jgi:hypothetical protein
MKNDPFSGDFMKNSNEVFRMAHINGGTVDTRLPVPINRNPIYSSG